MKKSLSQVLILSAALLLASCQFGGDEKSTAAPGTSEAGTSVAASEGGTSETGTSTPTGSTSTPTGSSSTSSRPSGTSSTPVASSSAAATMTYTPGAADIVKESDKIYLKFTGTLTGVTGDAAKFAFGIQHKANNNIGYVDPADGQWLVGSETPAAADYKYAPTIGNDGAFEVKIEITNVEFVKGSYTMFVGPQGGYAAIAVGQANYGQGTAELNGTKLIFRGDQNLLVAEELPPVHLTESTVEIDTENAKAYIKVGGELTISADAFEALSIKVSFERQVGGYSKTPKTGEDVMKVVDGTKGYVKVDITDLAEGGYQVKIGFDGQSEPNTTMECESYDKRNNPYVLGTKGYAPYFLAGGNAPETLYGCCGLFIQHAHQLTVGEKAEDSALRPVACVSNDYTGYELRAAEATSGQLAPSETGSGTSEKNTRLGKDDKFDDVWDISGIASGEYEVYLEARCSSGNANAGYWNSATAIAKGGRATDNGSTAELQSDYKYKVKVDDGAYENLGNLEDNYAATGLNESSKAWTNKALATIMINEGAETLTVHNMNNGYAIWVYAVRLVRIGNYMPPATNIVFDANNAAKIEAEDYATKHTIITNSGEETDYTSTNYSTDFFGTTESYPANLDGAVVDDATASGGKYVHGLYREGWNGRSNMSGELIYRVKLAEETNVKIKAKIKSNATTEKVCFDLKVDGSNKGSLNSANTWVEVESAEMTLAAGVHTIHFIGQQLGQSEGYTSIFADIDCFSLIKVTAAALA